MNKCTAAVLSANKMTVWIHRQNKKYLGVYVRGPFCARPPAHTTWYSFVLLILISILHLLYTVLRSFHAGTCLLCFDRSYHNDGCDGLYHIPPLLHVTGGGSFYTTCYVPARRGHIFSPHVSIVPCPHASFAAVYPTAPRGLPLHSVQPYCLQWLIV